MVLGIFRGSVQSREMRETRELQERVTALFRASILGRFDKERLTETMLDIAFDDVPDEIAGRLIPVARTIIEVLIDQEGLYKIPTVPEGVNLGLEEGARIRAQLREKERLYINDDLIDEWQKTLVAIFKGTIGE